MYVFGWIIVAAVILMVIYYVARQKRDIGCGVFPLNYRQQYSDRVKQEIQQEEEKLAE